MTNTTDWVTAVEDIAPMICGTVGEHRGRWSSSHPPMPGIDEQSHLLCTIAELESRSLEEGVLPYIGITYYLFKKLNKWYITPNESLVTEYRKYELTKHNIKKIDVELGIIGLGFVGTAVFEGLKGRYQIHTYDTNTDVETDCFDLKALVFMSKMIFICVPTPMGPNGECDTSIVESVVAEIDSFGFERDVIIKSTAIPGTTDALAEKYSNLNLYFNPEFLRQAHHIEDFRNQDRIIIGASDLVDNGHELWSPVAMMYAEVFRDVKIIETNAKTAELVKYVGNNFLALKVVFANELFNICENLTGVNYDELIDLAKMDKRLGDTHWKVPGDQGFGFDGACFCKDVSAFIEMSKDLGVESEVMSNAQRVNNTIRAANAERGD